MPATRAMVAMARSLIAGYPRQLALLFPGQL